MDMSGTSPFDYVLPRLKAHQDYAQGPESKGGPDRGYLRMRIRNRMRMN